MMFAKIIPRNYLVVIVIVLLAVVFPFLTPPTYYVGLVYRVFMWCAIALGYNIIGGYAGYPSLGTTVWYGIGGYTISILNAFYGLSPFLTWPLGVVLCVVAAFGIGFPCLKLRHAYFATVMLFIGFVSYVIVLNFPEVTFGGRGISIPSLPGDPRSVVNTFYYIMLCVAIGSAFLCYAVRRSRFGHGLLAIREDEDAAELAGVPTMRIKMLAFALSSIPVSIAGSLNVYYLTFCNPATTFNLMFSLFAILFCMIGGQGTIVGPILGASIMITLGDYIGSVFKSEMNVVIYGALTMLVIMFMPGGLVRYVNKGLARMKRSTASSTVSTEKRENA